MRITRFVDARARDCLIFSLWILIGPGFTASAAADPQAAADPHPTMEIYGFAEADAIVDFKVNDPDWFDTNRPSKLPSIANEFGQDGHFYFSPRHSRFGVQATLPTSAGAVQATFEFDMVGVGPNAGVTTIRLRHAWGQWKQVGAGQTFSQFMDPDVYPRRLDFWGPSGMLTSRTPQVFWQPHRAGESHLRVSIENPGASVDAGEFEDRIQLPRVKDHFRMPDVAGHYRHGTAWGYLQAGGIVRYIGWDDLVIDDPFDLTGHVWGWGASLSSNVKPTPNDILRLELVYGHGIENEINDAPIDVGIKLNLGNAAGRIQGEALPVVSLVAYLDHNWRDRWSTTAGYSRVDVSNSSGQLPNAFRIGQYATANLVWTPVTNVLMGGELQWARRTNFSDGFFFNDFRLEFSFKYSFSQRLPRP